MCSRAVLFSYVSVEERVPANHPLRSVRTLLNEVLGSMSRNFERVYADGGRASILPERLVRALTLHVLYSIRSERLLCEQLDYNLLFRWFVWLSIDEPVLDHSTFTKNRERLIEGKVARKLLRRVVRKAQAARLLSNEHFSVDGTLIESWAAVNSMRRRDGRDEPPGPGRNPMVDFHGERRTNDTHVSPSDPEALLYRMGKGEPAKLCFMGHVLMEHRHGLPVNVASDRDWQYEPAKNIGQLASITSPGSYSTFLTYRWNPPPISADRGKMRLRH